jgi:hypothetical protein
VFHAYHACALAIYSTSNPEGISILKGDSIHVKNSIQYYRRGLWLLSLFSSQRWADQYHNDYTKAYDQVTYDPRVVSDPGTTIDTFSAPLFPSAAFSGFNLVCDWTAKISNGGGNFNLTSCSA